MDAEDRNDAESGGEEQETPVCLRCFRPVSPLAHFCPHCGEVAGQFTPSLPFEGVRWQAQTWGKACRQIWSPDISIWGRWFRLLMVILSGPMLIIAVALAGGFSYIRPKRKHLHTGS
jgi:hypothetical protein